jgi:hypothetical protein
MGRKIFEFGFVVVAALVFSRCASAGRRNPADFPLRVHIFTHNSHSHYWNGGLSKVDGEGRANLYENSVPTAFEFSYECDTRLMNSVGYETYLARWKKQGSALELLVPATRTTCVVKADLDPGVAFRIHNGRLEQEPSAAFAGWMQRHHYDPEHGMDLPQGVDAAGDDAGSGQ